MKKFSKWLEKNPGMQAELSKALKCNRSCPSLVKTGRRPMPTSWFGTVIKLSGGTFTYEELVAARVKTQATLRKQRAAAREALAGEAK